MHLKAGKSRLSTLALKNDDHDLIEFLVGYGASMGTSLLQAWLEHAARKGDIDMIEMLICTARRSGHLSIQRYHEVKLEWGTLGQDVLNAARERGRNEVVRLLVEEYGANE